ncbi:MAG: DUF4129 domain-containing protein [Chloroflexi bacterium]|nr:DUF4129 domain-containing protein [Chloroflexota bacterium]
MPLTPSQKKLWITLLAVVGLAALIVLSSALRDVSFHGGEALGVREVQSVSQPMARFINSIDNMPLWKAVLIWAIVFLIFVLMSLVLSPALRRQLVRLFFRFTLLGLLIFLLIRYFRDTFTNLVLPEAAAAGQPPLQGGEVEVPVFEAPPASPWLSLAVSLVVAVALVMLVWGLVRWWDRRAKFLALQRPLEDIAKIARESLDGLEAGRAWDDVILESYFRMSQAVEKRRGLFREGAMTPSEFAARLETAGLPGDAVRRLTRLFESVRYGARTSTENEIREATICLTAILNYCGETA